MKKEIPPLKLKIKNLKVGGIPCFVDSHKDRINAGNFALRLGYKITTRKRIGREGYEIYRTA